MLDSLAESLEVSVPVLVVIGVLGLLQLALEVWAVVDLIRRPVVLYFNKWIWLAIILLGGVLGSIVYLAVGRGQPAAEEPAAEPGAATASRTRSAADVLYGPASGVAEPAGRAGQSEERGPADETGQPSGDRTEPGPGEGR